MKLALPRVRHCLGRHAVYHGPPLPRRDLFVSTFTPRLGNGRDLRTYTLLKALAANGPLDIAYVAYDGEPDPELVALPGVEFHEVTPSRGARRAAAVARARARGWPAVVARSCSPEVRAAAEQLAADPGRGRVIAGDLNAMAMLMGLARRRPVVYNAHNIESSYSRRLYGGRVRWLPIEVLERQVLKAVAESWMVSRPDVRRALEIAPGATVRYAPNVVDVAAIQPVAPRPGGVALMVADYRYLPNLLSVQWLIAEVLPRLWARLPHARVRFAGLGLELPGADERIEVAGFVEDLSSAYAQAAAVVVPLVEGAGTPLKFVEALAYGVPVVATPLAARGLSVQPGVHYRDGADAETFAGELATLIERGDADMAARGRRLAEDEYSVAALAQLVAVAAPARPGREAVTHSP